MIYVSAANSGNGASILERREPLALLAAHNIMHRYRIDSSRVYIGGFSGGSRVALRVALGYPDVFHGALLIAGSDPIGDLQAPLPRADLFRQFQESTRLVYITGADDTINLNLDAGSRQSLREWCVFDVDTEDMPRMGHEIADAGSLNRVLGALTKHTHADPAKLDDCRVRVEAELTGKLQQVAELLAGGKRDDARKLLEKIDSRYAGLATPQSIEFMQRIESQR
jgi:pimeloyl-ACP methyl ester carboxylesterase